MPLGEESLYISFCLDELGVKLSVWNDVCVCAQGGGLDTTSCVCMPVSLIVPF